MAPRESEPQKETVERVIHEYKHGELRSGMSGQKVKSHRQAVAIALSEAGVVQFRIAARERLYSLSPPRLSCRVRLPSAGNSGMRQACTAW